MKKNRIVSGICVGFCIMYAIRLQANTYIEDYRPAVYGSNGAKYLVRVEVPSSNSDGLITIPVELLRYDEKTHAYIKNASFGVKGMDYPQKCFITEDGKFIVAVIDTVTWEGGESVLQIYNSAGNLIKGFHVSDIWSSEEVAMYKKYDSRPRAGWLSEATVGKNSSGKYMIYLKCRDVLNGYKISDYIVYIDPLSVVSVDSLKKQEEEQRKNEPMGQP
jgi:hypothetical protein